MSIQSSRNIRDAIIVAAVALILQTVHLAEGSGDPTFDVPIVDSGRYHLDAARFAQGGSLTSGAFFQPPLFPLLLGCTYQVFGVHVAAPKVLLALAAVASCVLLGSIGRRLFGARVGLIAGLMFAAYGPYLFFSTQLLPTGPAILLILAALRLLLGLVEQPSEIPESRSTTKAAPDAGGSMSDSTNRGRPAYAIRPSLRWFLFGLLVGLGTVTVPNTVVLLPVAGGVLLAVALRTRRWQGTPVMMAMACIGTVLPAGVTTAHNYARSGEWVVLGNNGGINFHLGNNLDTDRTLALRPGYRWYQYYRSAFAAGATTPAAQNESVATLPGKRPGP